MTNRATASIAVVGAGAFGGWTALHLLRMGARVTLVDSWGPGNSRSSSGGESRVIRATYGPDREYTRMVVKALDLWKSINRSTTGDLYTETGVLWMHRGDDAYVRSSLPAFEEAGLSIEQLDLSDASRRYPQIELSGIRSIWLEERGGALSARRACGAVRDLFVSEGGTVRTGWAEPASIANDHLTGLRLPDGSTIEADAYVFACGPWLGRIFPNLLDRWIRPTRQEVFYFGTPSGSTRYLPASLPAWIDFGERIVYGVPDVHGRGLKIADDTRGEPFDPTGGDRIPSREGAARARQMIAERFPELANAPLVEARVCQYENSPDGQLIIDRHPEARNTWIVGGGSGHGFKLSPAVGEIVAKGVLLDGEIRETFRLRASRLAAPPSTQFDTTSRPDGV